MSKRGLTNANAVEKIIVALNLGKGSTIDLSAMVNTMNIHESITGDLYGNIEILDNAGIIDNVVLTGDEFVNISFTYYELTIKHVFFFNGIKNIAIDDSQNKTYEISLGSINEYISATNLVSKSYTGKSSDIITKIFLEYFVFDTLLLKDTSKSSGRYIAPNISPKSAIETIRNSAYDIEGSIMLMFQSLALQGVTVLDSLYNILQQTPIYTISPTLGFSDEVNKGITKQVIGRPSKIIINDNEDIIGISGAGIKGRYNDYINLDTSSSNKTMFRGTSRPGVNKLNPLRSNMYNDKVKPIHTEEDNDIITNAKYAASVALSISATAYHTPAIPGLSVGNIVTLDVTDSTKIRKNSQLRKSRKYHNNYIVTGIDHRFSEGLYEQNITMATGII